MARLPHRVLENRGIGAWMVALVVVIAVVNGARTIARAPFTLARASSAGAWARREIKVLAVTIAAGSALTIPLYALLRSTPHWWLPGWLLFVVVTVVGQLAMPLTMRAQAGPLEPADHDLAQRVVALGTRAGVDVGGGVLVAAGKGDGKQGKEGKHCNAYVVGLGATRRVVLGGAVAAWPAEVCDQVVAHELAHWRLGHGARRLPLTFVVQFATFALAALVLSWSPLLGWGGVASAGDPRSYPLLLILTAALTLPARLLLAGVDRSQERAADEFALTLLQQPRQFAEMLDRAADEGNAPRQLPWYRRAIASHPPIDERLLACTQFASTA
ncbi:MAG: M48 family metalloprotease [Acidimicrobiales bacterium]